MNNIEILDNTPLEKDNEGETIEVGQWYWVLNNVDYKKDPKPDWLGCIMQIGSNYVELNAPSAPQGGTKYVRVRTGNKNASLL